MFFRQLTAAEDTRFRRWAREYYRPGSPIDSAWHPVIQEECALVNRERATFIVDGNDAEELGQ